MDTQEVLEQELSKIQKWEKSQRSLFIWDKIGRLPFVLLDRVLPNAVRNKIGDMLNDIGQYVQHGGKFLIDKHKVVVRMQEKAAEVGCMMQFQEWTEDGSGMPDIRDVPIAVLDQVADDLTQSRMTFATVQGATTGIGGIVTLAADIPLVIGLSLKVLQEMALSYGFDPEDPLERIFILKCLQFSSADIVGKRAILAELSDYDNPDKQLQLISQMQGWREVFNAYVESFGWKKLFQFIPVAGMVFGSISNRSTIANIAECGKMLYKKRLVLQRLQTQTSTPLMIDQPLPLPNR